MAFRKRSWGGIVVGTVLALYWGYDFQQMMSDSGIYRRDFAGTVVSARPSIDAVIDFFERSGRTQSVSRSRHYLVTLRDDAGKTSKVAVSRDEYYRTLIPSYLVGKGGQIRHFPSRESAVAAGAAD
jgi:hypothetical protein